MLSDQAFRLHDDPEGGRLWQGQMSQKTRTPEKPGFGASNPAGKAKVQSDDWPRKKGRLVHRQAAMASAHLGLFRPNGASRSFDAPVELPLARNSQTK